MNEKQLQDLIDAVRKIGNELGNINISLHNLGIKNIAEAIAYTAQLKDKEANR